MKTWKIQNNPEKYTIPKIIMVTMENIGFEIWRELNGKISVISNNANPVQIIPQNVAFRHISKIKV